MSRITNPLPQLIPARAYHARTRVQGMIWGPGTPVELFIGPVNEEFIPLAEGMRQPMRLLAPGEFFGPTERTWKQCWAKMEIPAAAPGEAERRFLRWEGFGENTVFYRGVPWWGIDWAHKEMPLPAEACTLWMSCGLWHDATPNGLQYKQRGDQRARRAGLAGVLGRGDAGAAHELRLEKGGGRRSRRLQLGRV